MINSWRGRRSRPFGTGQAESKELQVADDDDNDDGKIRKELYYRSDLNLILILKSRLVFLSQISPLADIVATPKSVKISKWNAFLEKIDL